MEQPMKRFRCAMTLSLLCLLAVATSASAQPQTLVRTAQMWGTEKSEGKVAATVGIAGECVQTGKELACQFVALSFSTDEKCTVMVAGWSQHLKLVSRTRDEVQWVGTKGPTGLAGVVATTSLVVKRNSLFLKDKDFFNRPGDGPGAFDLWSYQETQVFTQPLLGGKKMPPVTTEVASLGDHKFCRPTEAMLMAITPD
jgi:hypothetical protein